MIFGTSVFATWTPKRSMRFYGSYKLDESKDFKADNVMYNKDLRTQVDFDRYIQGDVSFTWTFALYSANDNV